LKRVLIKRFGRIPALTKDFPVHMPEADPALAHIIRSTVAADGYTGGTWLFKCSCMYYKLFLPFAPIIITVRRSVQAIRESNLVSNMIRGDIEEPIEAHTKVLDALEEKGALRIDSERLIERDYEQVKRVFQACGLTFDPAAADLWVEPSLWHYGGGR
jgi:hypothetical protein